MAIKSVTNANLAEYVAERTAKGSEIQTGEQMAAKVEAIAEAKKESPVVEAAATAEIKSPDPGVQEPTAKKKNPVQPRIDELTREKRELEEFAESEYEMRLRAERRIGELENELKAAKPVEQPKVEEEKEPDPTKYTDQAAFLKDWGAWNRKQALKEFNEQAARERQAAEAAVQAERLKKQVEIARAEFSDFDEVISDGMRKEGKDLTVPNHVKAAILDSDVGAHLAYYLRKNPAEEARIYALKPAKALLELGKLEMQFTKKADVATSASDSKPPVTTIETSKAPPPPPSLSQASGIVPQDMSKPMDFKSYRNARLEQMRQRARR